jgi:transcriptional regulator with XRE-family HTH domain
MARKTSSRSKKPQPNRKRSATPYDKMVGNNLRMLRLQAMMTQKELADKLGLSFQQIQKYEKGINRLNGEKLSQIAETFGVTVHTLLNVSTVGGDGGSTPIVDRQSFLFMQSFQTLPPAVRACIARLVEELKS